MSFIELSPPAVVYSILIEDGQDPYFIPEDEIYSWSKDILPEKGEWYILTAHYEMQVAHGPVFTKIVSKYYSEGKLRKENLNKLVEDLRSEYETVSRDRKDLFYKPLRAIAKVLLQLGYDVAHGPDPYLGLQYFMEGIYDKFAASLKNAYKILKENDVEKIVTTSPGITTVLNKVVKKHVPEWDIEFKHYHELIDEKLSKLPKKQSDMKVTVHDCHHWGIINKDKDIPGKLRRMLDASGIAWTEPYIYSREKVQCCGAPCGLFHSLTTAKAADNRLEQLLEPAYKENAKIIVMSCPSCFNALYAALQRSHAKDEVKMIDATLLVHQHLWGEP